MPRPAADSTATQARILEAAEAQLRRFGPEKLTVGDIARGCGMSHPNLYRFFPGKAAMLQAITARWLGDVREELSEIAARDEPAVERVCAFFIALHRNKVRKVLGDPELFKVYHALIEGNCDVLKAHIAALGGIGGDILRDGVARGEFPTDTDVCRAVLGLREATTIFVDPRLVEATVAAGNAEERLTMIIRIYLAGVAARGCRLSQP